MLFGEIPISLSHSSSSKSKFSSFLSIGSKKSFAQSSSAKSINILLNRKGSVNLMPKIKIF